MDINKSMKECYLNRQKFAVIIFDDLKFYDSLTTLLEIKIKREFLNIVIFKMSSTSCQELVELYHIQEFPAVLIFNKQRLIRKEVGFNAQSRLKIA